MSPAERAQAVAMLTAAEAMRAQGTALLHMAEAQVQAANALLSVDAPVPSAAMNGAVEEIFGEKPKARHYGTRPNPEPKA